MKAIFSESFFFSEKISEVRYYSKTTHSMSFKNVSLSSESKFIFKIAKLWRLVLFLDIREIFSK